MASRLPCSSQWTLSCADSVAAWFGIGSLPSSEQEVSSVALSSLFVLCHSPAPVPVQVRLLISVFNFRMNRRLMEPDTPTFYVEVDHSASAREGCTVSTLAVTSEPKDWRPALQALPCCFSSVCFVCWLHEWH